MNFYNYIYDLLTSATQSVFVSFLSAIILIALIIVLGFIVDTIFTLIIRHWRDIINLIYILMMVYITIYTFQIENIKKDFIGDYYYSNINNTVY